MDLKNSIEFLKGFFTKYKKIIIMVVVGCLMVILGNMLLDVSGGKEPPKMFLPQATRTPGLSESENGMVLMGPDEYANYLQMQIEDLLSTIDGVGKVKVLVYVDESCELVPAYDSERNESTLEEQDSEGGKRKQNDYRERKDIFDSNGTVVLKVVYPKVKGIVVSAQGAKSNVVKEHIMNALVALYGIEPHRVEILSMKS